MAAHLLRRATEELHADGRSGSTLQFCSPLVPTGLAVNILFCGDVMGRPGREAIKTHLPALRRRLALDLVVVNAENAAAGRGLTERLCGEFFDCGVDILTTGNTGGTGPRADGGGIATDQTGSGTSYRFVFPESMIQDSRYDFSPTQYSTTDFFQVNGVGRTFGLLQQSQPGATPDPQWPLLAGFTFAVNPVNGNQIVISSNAGRVFGTVSGSLVLFVLLYEITTLYGQLLRAVHAASARRD